MLLIPGLEVYFRPVGIGARTILAVRMRRLMVVNRAGTPAQLK